MPRLLLINVALNWGSTGKIVEGIGKLAISKGWDVYVGHGARYKSISVLKDVQVSSKVGEIIHYIESSLFDAQGLGSRCETKRFLKQLDLIKPDLIHIHNIHGCFLNYPLLFKYIQSHKIPTIWTFHDCWPMTGHCVHFDKSKCTQWQSACLRCPQLRDFPSSFLLDRSHRNFVLKKTLFTSLEKFQITTVSSWLKNVATLSYLSKYTISIVPNGVNTEMFRPTESKIRQRYGLENKKVLLAVASGFGERKGLNEYVALASKLSPEYQLLLVGVSKSDKKVLPNSIITINKANGAEELAAYYTTADVLLSLSYEETFGMTIVEAMACGTPAIVYDNTAQPELITAETGKVVPTGDLDSLIEAIEDICSKPKDEYSNACRSHSLEYDEKVSYQKYMNIYDSVINQGKSCISL